MLQQTQVDTALPYFERFLDRFPTVEDLAQAPLDEVLELWTGLGYYSRARNLHKAAKLIADMGNFPFDIKGLRALPGVGEYMAAAIASIAFGLDEATVDGNIARVMSRLHADPGPRKGMWAHARAHLPAGRAGDYNQALMDLGARICRPRSPRCSECPVATHCEGLRRGVAEALPPKKTKKVVPVRQMVGLVFREGDRVLLGRRPESGLWGGLWEFPSIVSDGPAWTSAERSQVWNRSFGAEFSVGGSILSARHVLSHRVFEFSLLRATGPVPATPGLYQELRWVPVEPLPAIGLSALTARGVEAMRAQAH